MLSDQRRSGLFLVDTVLFLVELAVAEFGVLLDLTFVRGRPNAGALVDDGDETAL